MELIITINTQLSLIGHSVAFDCDIQTIIIKALLQTFKII